MSRMTHNLVWFFTVFIPAALFGVGVSLDWGFWLLPILAIEFVGIFLMVYYPVVDDEDNKE